MSFDVKIISPIKVDETDLRRRQIRYSEHALPDTKVKVFNLRDGPRTLDSEEDMQWCEAAVLDEGMQTDSAEFDAILIDCVFDPALTGLRDQGSVPAFGPMMLTLPLVRAVANRFSFVARAERQTEWLAEMAELYGFEDRLVSARALGITYEESRQPSIFDEAMSNQLTNAIQKDGAKAVVMGSTTMAISNAVTASAGDVPLFLPGMVGLRTMEHLWKDGLLR